jgi:hypothetical protein
MMSEANAPTYYNVAQIASIKNILSKAPSDSDLILKEKELWL